MPESMCQVWQIDGCLLDPCAKKYAEAASGKGGKLNGPMSKGL